MVYDLIYFNGFVLLFFLLNVEHFSVILTNSQLVKDIDFTNNVCPVCHKAFNRKAHVHRHYVELHMGHAEWACRKCDKKFKRRYLMEHHSKSCNVRCQNQCWSCMTVYPTQAKLIEHKEKKHSLSLF